MLWIAQQRSSLIFETVFFSRIDCLFFDRYCIRKLLLSDCLLKLSDWSIRTTTWLCAIYNTVHTHTVISETDGTTAVHFKNERFANKIIIIKITVRTNVYVQEMLNAYYAYVCVLARTTSKKNAQYKSSSSFGVKRHSEGGDKSFAWLSTCCFQALPLPTALHLVSFAPRLLSQSKNKCAHFNKTLNPNQFDSTKLTFQTLFT